MWVLSRDKQAVGDDVNYPVGHLREDRAQFQHLIFDKKWHYFGEADVCFLAVGEAGHFLALNQRLALWRLDVTQHARGMTHYADWLTCGKEGLDQLDGVLVLGEIPHRTVAARIEDGVEVFLPDAVEAKGLVELSFRSHVLLEPQREVGAEFGFVALGVQRRPATLRGRERDPISSIFENVVGSSQLFEPEAGLATGVAQLIVGCQHHKYPHALTPLLNQLWFGRPALPLAFR